jgi:IK cytokine
VLTNEDVDALDEAYIEASSTSRQQVPKKRTREDIIRELKEARGSKKLENGAAAPKTAEEEARLLEEAKQKGKFKPIGFKPIGSASEGKKKKTKTNDAGAEQKKKKKRKIEAEDGLENKDTVASTSMLPPSVPVKSNEAPQEIEEPFNDDFDIFADAGEYEGLNFDDDDKDEAAAPKPSSRDFQALDEPPSLTAPRRWIPTDDEPLQAPQHLTAVSSSSTAHPEKSRLSPPKESLTSEDEDMEDEQPTRLVPLSSSAIPSIKELLAMDKAAGSHAKNKKRKDKKKAGEGDHDEEPKKKSTEEKVDRDYKRLVLHTNSTSLWQLINGTFQVEDIHRKESRCGKQIN